MKTRGAEALEAIGLTESGTWSKLTRAAYHLLGLGAYRGGSSGLNTFKRGMKAQAAGIIHSDLRKGFIRAVTMSYDDLVNMDCGRLREEGKEYIVQDDDIMEFPLMCKSSVEVKYIGWKNFSSFLAL